MSRLLGSGMSLFGERGLFLNPAYDAWREKHYGPHSASGDWKELADRVYALRSAKLPSGAGRSSKVQLGSRA